MKLYGGARSPFFRECRVVLEEKGIPYEVERLAPVPKTPELLAMHPHLESKLSADREWLPPRFGIADIAVGTQLQGLGFSGEEIDTTRWPRTAACRRAIEARPSFKTAIC